MVLLADPRGPMGLGTNSPKLTHGAVHTVATLMFRPVPGLTPRGKGD